MFRITALRSSANLIKREAHPQEANPKGPQSSGPTGPAVAIAAVGLGVGYWIFGSKSHGKAKEHASGDLSLKEENSTTHSDKL
ncbi:hypothetical protein NQZ79_g6933 [Umbelopsis isabellina]|nr:hypothetical protein NQZ79_g6933 [Umbelopsis isabellina]